jgi:hypothetical protein
VINTSRRRDICTRMSAKSRKARKDAVAANNELHPTHPTRYVKRAGKE